jgi:hypothetical protein
LLVASGACASALLLLYCSFTDPLLPIHLRILRVAGGKRRLRVCFTAALLLIHLRILRVAGGKRRLRVTICKPPC